MPEPMYRQIAEDLRQKIESGQLGHGEQLPTELELSELYSNASRNTVRDAIRWLVTRGLVETRPGHGTFVVEKIDPFVTSLDHVTGFVGGETVAYLSEVKANRRTPTIGSPRVEIQVAAGSTASDLGLPDGTQVVVRHQQRYIDGSPYSLQTTFYPMTFVIEGGAARLIQAEEIPEGAVTYLEQKLGVRQAGWRDTITVRAPDLVETAFFKLPSNGRVAVIEIQRTGFTESGQPLRLTVTVYPADRNQFVMTVGTVPQEASADAVTGAAEGSAAGSGGGARGSADLADRPDSS